MAKRYIRAAPRTYVQAMPETLPAGQVLVHDALQRWRADNGRVYGRFRLWLQTFDRSRLSECDCGLARHHYTTKPELGRKPGPRQTRSATLPPLASLG